MNMPGTRWTLFAEPAQGWPDHPASPADPRTTVGHGTAGNRGHLLAYQPYAERPGNAAPVLGSVRAGTHRHCALQQASWRPVAINRAFDQSFGDLASSLQYFERGFDQHGQPIPGGLGIQRRLENDVSFSGVESYLPGPDQALKPIMLQGLRLETRDSESVVWLITEDISAQKKADRLKNEFISTVSHELRTP